MIGACVIPAPIQALGLEPISPFPVPTGISQTEPRQSSVM